MKRVWITTVALVLVLGAAGYTIAQSPNANPPNEMMGSGMGMMGGGMMSADTKGMMMGHSLTPEQLEQMAKQHGMTVEQAKQMTDACNQVMEKTGAEETRPQ